MIRSLADVRRHRVSVLRPAMKALHAEYPTLPPRLLGILVRAGYTTPAALAAATEPELAAINEIGPKYLALLRVALGLPDVPPVGRGPTLTETDLTIMAARPRLVDVPRLVAEVRRLRAILTPPGNGAHE